MKRENTFQNKSTTISRVSTKWEKKNNKKSFILPIPKTTIFTNPVAFLPNNRHFFFSSKIIKRAGTRNRQTHIRCRFDIAKWRIRISKRRRNDLDTKRQRRQTDTLYCIDLLTRTICHVKKISCFLKDYHSSSSSSPIFFIFGVFQVFSSRRNWQRLSEEE